MDAAELQTILAPSAPFREIAERIDRNPVEEFSGAYMVVLRDGTQISGLLIDPEDNPAMLLSNVMVKLDLAIKRIEDEEAKSRQQFGGYR